MFITYFKIRTKITHETNMENVDILKFYIIPIHSSILTNETKNEFAILNTCKKKMWVLHPL